MPSQTETPRPAGQTAPAHTLARFQSRVGALIRYFFRTRFGKVVRKILISLLIFGILGGMGYGFYRYITQ
ncbi:hypothetical protein BDW74DRAFT_164370 [Aspergillus multicolor]|uniref:uncharacterized protein n=1 Tax=Aspergillus multicolor TaxID=41759 RepID=UPI003CCE180C